MSLTFSGTVLLSEPKGALSPFFQSAGLSFFGSLVWCKKRPEIAREAILQSFSKTLGLEARKRSLSAACYQVSEVIAYKRKSRGEKKSQVKTDFSIEPQDAKALHMLLEDGSNVACHQRISVKATFKDKENYWICLEIA